ncbi:hypothetical protein K461DRAFT_274880 [Myriangium duriaei CBS 260.36]|uniref:Uncharacterized protein n=1 Tax=Myriangium duriaei CBS 260.36 TaxID=1168546 RepID=A0A9P4J6L8_9PEZI|nr:hypothetical protein K461DRAFT_274880 [Myriangium duriaei CBS 260.36]
MTSMLRLVHQPFYRLAYHKCTMRLMVIFLMSAQRDALVLGGRCCGPYGKLVLHFFVGLPIGARLVTDLLGTVYGKRVP